MYAREDTGRTADSQNIACSSLLKRGERSTGNFFHQLYYKIFAKKICAKGFFDSFFEQDFVQGCHMHKNVTKYLKAARILTLWIQKIIFQ